MQIGRQHAGRVSVLAIWHYRGRRSQTVTNACEGPQQFVNRSLFLRQGLVSLISDPRDGVRQLRSTPRIYLYLRGYHVMSTPAL